MYANWQNRVIRFKMAAIQTLVSYCRSNRNYQFQRDQTFYTSFYIQTKAQSKKTMHSKQPLQNDGLFHFSRFFLFRLQTITAERIF